MSYYRSEHLDDTSECGQIFGGDGQKSRYYKAFMRVITAAEPSVDFGTVRSNISTHSIRKTADTLAVNQPCGPGATVVRIRAGHSLGKVQDCYQKEDPSGDCFCGRTLTMEPMTTPDFAMLPPHFSKAGMLKVLEIGFLEKREEVFLSGLF